MNIDNSLDCIPFSDFLLFFDILINQDIKMPSHISFSKLPSIKSLENNLQISDLIKSSIIYCINKNIPNVITRGYKLSYDKLLVNGPNNLISILLTYDKLLEIIGDELFMKILVECRLFCEMEGKDESRNLLMICGNMKNEKKNLRINRHKLFYKNKQEIKIYPRELIEKYNKKEESNNPNNKSYINNISINNISINNISINNISINEEVFRKCQEKYTKLKIDKLFYKYMKEVKNQIDPQILINFLFCVSKKILPNIFDRFNFRILKQKIVLLVYKNKFESFSEEEIIRHFKITNFRFFSKRKVYKDFKDSINGKSNLMDSMNGKSNLMDSMNGNYNLMDCMNKEDINLCMNKEDLNSCINDSGMNKEDINTCIDDISCKYSHTRRDYTFMMQFTKEYLFFLFNDFFIPLINKFVYCTESCSTKFKCLYFKRHTFYKFSDECANIHLSDTKKYKLLSKTKKFPNNIRIIPKQEGGRVVVNLNLNSDLNISNLSLRNVYEIIKKENRKKLMNSMLGFEDMEEFIYPLINRKRLYCMKVDVKKCFDNIPHEYIEKIIEKIFKEEHYYIRTFQESRTTTSTSSSSSTKYNNTSSSQTNYNLVTSSTKYNNTSSTKYNNNNNTSSSNYKKIITYEVLEYSEYFRMFKDKIIIDESNLKEYSRQELIKFIKKSLLGNKISYKNLLYRQIQGIPQGSILSTIFCSLYFAQLDKKYFNNIFKQGKLIRFVDDFLILSPCKEEILRFIKISTLLKNKGVIFNTEKTETNFDIKETNLILRNTEMNYLGMKIITKEDNVFFKNNLQDKNIQYGIYSPSHNIGNMIFKKMSRFIDTRTYILINKENKKVYENIYDTLVIYIWKLEILFKRSIFVNREYYSKMIRYGIKKMKMICKKREIKISQETLQEMINNILQRGSRQVI
ncbi:telomerase reverse transcriptase (TERT) [Vairimorpha necatrix]|uniref:Telomerase reverse transcriptase n=1 Tax=Vairimorpha necatrix TaxID=6039 RepID=A0AAX4JAB7_9MICR